MSTILIPSDLISQAEAARLRGCSRQAISRLIQRGKIKVYHIAGFQFLSKAEILKYEAKPGGRPKSLESNDKIKH